MKKYLLLAVLLGLFVSELYACHGRARAKLRSGPIRTLLGR